LGNLRKYKIELKQNKKKIRRDPGKPLLIPSSDLFLLGKGFI
jgi:hypothetical protein